MTTKSFLFSDLSLRFSPCFNVTETIFYKKAIMKKYCNLAFPISPPEITFIFQLSEGPQLLFNHRLYRMKETDR